MRCYGFLSLLPLKTARRSRKKSTPPMCRSAIYVTDRSANAGPGYRNGPGVALRGKGDTLCGVQCRISRTSDQTTVSFTLPSICARKFQECQEIKRSLCHCRALSATYELLDNPKTVYIIDTCNNAAKKIYRAQMAFQRWAAMHQFATNLLLCIVHDAAGQRRSTALQFPKKSFSQGFIPVSFLLRTALRFQPTQRIAWLINPLYQSSLYH